jgi:hypothetical protein
MKSKLLLTLFSLMLIVSVPLMVSAQPDQRFPWRLPLSDSDRETLERLEQQIENYIKFRIVISGLNIILYTYILAMYVQLYQETKSKFSMGLVALSSVLLIYSISSNPIVLFYLRGTEPAWLNIFNTLPDVFASIAAIIMIYLTRT